MSTCPFCDASGQKVQMELLTTWGDPIGGYQYDLLQCRACGGLVKEDLEGNKGKMLINVKNVIIHENLVTNIHANDVNWKGVVSKRPRG